MCPSRTNPNPRIHVPCVEHDTYVENLRPFLGSKISLLSKLSVILSSKMSMIQDRNLQSRARVGDNFRMS